MEGRGRVKGSGGRETQCMSDSLLVFDCLFAYFVCLKWGLTMEPAVLELTMYTRMASNSRRSICLCFSSAWIKGVCHYACLLSDPLITVRLEGRNFSVQPGYSYFSEKETEAQRNEPL